MKVTVQKENMTRKVYLRNILQNEISKIASEWNILMVKNITDIPAAILHQNSFFSPSLFQTCLYQTLVCTVSRCWKRSFKLFFWKELQDIKIQLQYSRLLICVNYSMFLKNKTILLCVVYFAVLQECFYIKFYLPEINVIQNTEMMDR